MDYTVGDLIAQFLEAAGVKTAFGIVSVHNIPLLDAIGRRDVIRFVPTRGEMGAGHMADAYARASGGLGVMFSSTGPGAANAVGGLVEARFASSPVLHITGQSATHLQGRDSGAVHDFPQQSEMLASVCKSTYRPGTADEVLPMLGQAFSDAMSDPRGPVTLEIAADLQSAKVQQPASFDSFITIRAAQQPKPQDLDMLADMLHKARRPMLWLGNGARGAEAQAQALVDMGLGAVSSWAGRAIIPEDHPLTLGALHGNGAPEIEDFYDTVDLMIVVGSRLRGHETLDGALRLPRNLVKIDIDPRAGGRNYSSATVVQADAAATLAGLCERVQGRLQLDPAFAGDLARARRAAAQSYRTTLGPYADFPAQLRAAMPRDALWVRDGTVAGHTWAHRLMPLYGARDSVHPVSGSIGAGLGFAIGAAMAARHTGRKTVLITGDGGFAMNIGELWTAVQERADLCIIVMNDGQYSAIAFIQDAAQQGRRFFGQLKGPDLEGLAALAGMPFWRVRQADAFGSTVAKALAVPGPTLLEVDMHAIGPVPPYGHKVRKA